MNPCTYLGPRDAKKAKFAPEHEIQTLLVLGWSIWLKGAHLRNGAEILQIKITLHRYTSRVRSPCKMLNHICQLRREVAQKRWYRPEGLC